MTVSSFSDKAAVVTSAKAKSKRRALLLASAAASAVMLVGSTLPVEAACTTEAGVGGNTFYCSAGETYSTTNASVATFVVGPPPAAAAAIGTLLPTGAVGGSVTFYGTSTSVDLSPTNPVTSGSVDAAHHTTDLYSSTAYDVAGSATLLNNGSIGSSVDMFGSSVVVTNGETGTIGGSVTLDSADTTGTQNIFQQTTYYDPSGTDTYSNADNTALGGNLVYGSTTTTSIGATFGGAVSFTNMGSVGGGVSADAAGTITFVNQGTTSGDATIGGAVSLSTGYGSGPIGSTTSNTVHTESHSLAGTNGVTTDVQSTLNSSSYSFTPTGGAITADNGAYGVIGGGLYALAGGDATVSNEGLVTGGDVYVNADPLVMTSGTGSSLTATTISTDVTATDTTTTPGNTTTVTVAGSAITRIGGGYGFTNTDTSGGTGSFVNAGTVGTSGSHVNVHVSGDTAAALTNATGATIYGGYVGVVSDPVSRSNGYSYAFTSAPTTSTTTTTVSAGTTAELSSQTVTTMNYMHSHADLHTSSVTYGAGNASLANSGDLNANGAVYVQVGGGTASLSNDGTIEATRVVVNGGTYGGGPYLVNTSHSHGDSSVRTSADTATVIDVAGVSYSTSDVHTSSHNRVEGWSSTVSNNASTAMLDNSGTIGVSTTSTPVYVYGGGMASLSNAGGTIYGDVTVSGAGMTTNRSGQEASNRSSVETSTSLDVTSVAGLTTTDVVSSTDAGTSAHDWNSTYTSVGATNGGTASADNSGMVVGGVYVIGNGSASGTNSAAGTITGGVYVSASDTSASYTHTRAHTSSETYSTSDGATFVNGTMVSEGGIAIDPTTFDHSWSHTYSVAYVGGMASYVNDGTAAGVSVSGALGASLDNSGLIGDTASVFNFGYLTSAEESGGASGVRGTTASYDETTSVVSGDNVTAGSQTFASDSTGSWSHDSSSTYSPAGGTASFGNAATGTVGSNVFVYGEDAAIGTNAGTIGKDVYVRAGTFTSSNASDSSGTWARSTSASLSSTYNDDASAGTAAIGYYPSISQTMTSSSVHQEAGSWATDTVYTGGVASLTNSAGGVIAGGATVSGPGSATLDNAGMLDANTASPRDIYVTSLAQNTMMSGNDSSTSTSNSTSDYGYAESLVSVGTLTVASATKTVTGDSTSTSTDNYARSTVYEYTGGNATLINEAGATIGSPLTTSLGNVYVDPMGTASVVNSGTIYANVYIGNYGRPLFDTTMTETSAHTRVQTGTTSNTATGSPTGVVTPPLMSMPYSLPGIGSTSSFDNKHTVAVDWSSEHDWTVSGTAVGGPVNYTDTPSSKLYGSLYVTAGGGNDANITVNGTVGEITGVHGYPPFATDGGALDVVAWGGSFSGNLSETRTGSFNGTFESFNPNTTPTTAAPSVTTYLKTTTEIEHNTSAAEGSWTAGSGMASLTVNGTVGFESTHPINVLVQGQGGASLLVNTNGQINGNADVSSSAYDLSGSVTATEDTTNTTNSTVTQTTPFSGPTVYVTDAVVDNSSVMTGGGAIGVTAVGGSASAINMSNTITGDLTVSGFAGAVVQNIPGAEIWGDVTIDSSGTNLAAAGTFGTFSDTTTTTTPTDTTVDFSSDVTFAVSGTSADAGGNSLLINQGYIGNLVNNGLGYVYVYDANGSATAGGQGNVIMSANGDVSAANTDTGVIYGSLSENADGTTATFSFSSDENLSTSTVTTTAGPTVDLAWSATSYLSTDYTHTGGTATVVNNGQIGRRFASESYGPYAPVTPGAGVYLAGDAGAFLVNNGLIGTDAQARSSVSDGSGTASETSTIVSHISGATMDYAIHTETSDVAWARSSVGGSATITNSASGTIGADTLSGNGIPVASGAVIMADGDAGALIENQGLMQGTLIEAYSFGMNRAYNSNFTSADAYVGPGAALFYTATETSSSHYTSTPTSGTAKIDNSGQMLSTEDPLRTAGPAYRLTVQASAYSSAEVTNESNALIDGNVVVTAFGDTYVHDFNLTQTESVVGVTRVLDQRVGTDMHSHTYGGGVANLYNDPSATITGNAFVSGYDQATATNDVMATINGSLTVNSAFANVTRDEMVTTYGPGYGALSTPGTNNPTALIPTATDSFTQTSTYTGGDASIVNSGWVGGNATAIGFNSASILNNAGATIGGSAYANSLFFNLTNVNGIVTWDMAGVGGTASIENYGTIGGGFAVAAQGSTTATLYNDNAAWIAGSSYVNPYDAFGYGPNTLLAGYMLAYAPDAMNVFTNYGQIGAMPSGGSWGLLFSGLTGSGVLGTLTPNDVIEFAGNTTAFNAGIINENLAFYDANNGGSSSALFEFGQGSVLTGNITNDNDGLSNLTLQFDNSGLYQGNIYNATTTNKVGAGTWILTGSSLGLGEANINQGTLEIGTPINYFMANPNLVIAVALNLATGSTAWDPLTGLNPFYGNTAVNPALQGQNVSSSLIKTLAASPIVYGNINVGAQGALEGRAIILGDVNNSGTFLPGWMLASDATKPLGNLLDNTNQILPSQFEVSGDYTQSDTGTYVTNFAPTVNRAERQLVGVQPELFAPTEYWLQVSPFAPDYTPSVFTTVDGSATVGGKVKVYVNKGGLYVNGDSRDIMSSVGDMTVTATTSQSAPSLFVGFDLATRTNAVTGDHILSVVVDRTSYASVATTPNERAVGQALDSAVPEVAGAITANNFGSVADFTVAQDMAGFLADMDWQVGTASQAAAILSDLSPDGYAALPSIDTGAGFRSQITRHLTEQRGSNEADPATGLWLQGYGISQKVDAHHGARGISGSTTGLSGGWDVTIDNVVVGLAAGYGRTSLDSGSSRFDGGISAYQFGVYGSANFGPWYMDATLWGNVGDGHVTRRLANVGRTAYASIKPTEFRADAEGGYRFNMDGGWGLTPYLSLSYRNSSYSTIHETGAGGLGYDITNMGGSLFTPELGVTADGQWTLSDTVSVKPLAGLGIAFNSKPDNPIAQFQGGGMPFTIQTAATDNVSVRPEVGFDFKVGSTFSVQFGYQGSLGGSGDSHGGWIGVRGDW